MEETQPNRNIDKSLKRNMTMVEYKRRNLTKQVTMMFRPAEKSNSLREVGKANYFEPKCRPITYTAKPLLDRQGINDHVNLYKGADINTELDRIETTYRSQNMQCTKLLGDYQDPRT